MITKFIQYLRDVVAPAALDLQDVQASILNPLELAALEASILNAFKSNPEPRSGYMLMRELGLSSGAIYRALWKLELDGRLVSYWADEHFPRRRFYKLPDTRSEKKIILRP